MIQKKFTGKQQTWNLVKITQIGRQINLMLIDIQVQVVQLWIQLLEDGFLQAAVIGATLSTSPNLQCVKN